MVYREFRVDGRLAPFVECGWLRSGSSARSVRVIPDGSVDIFVTADGDIMVAGPARTYFDLPVGHGDVVTGLRLHPGAAAAVIDCPASEFRDQRRLLDSTFGLAGPRTADSVRDATTPRERVTRLAAAVADSFAGAEPTIDLAVTWAIRELRTTTRKSVSALAKEIGLSERQLRRRFENAVGYGPKRLGRIFRFQRLLCLIHEEHRRADWSELAIAAGYTDQSHMINECLSFAGGPPTSLPMSVSSNTAPRLPS